LRVFEAFLTEILLTKDGKFTGFLAGFTLYFAEAKYTRRAAKRGIPNLSKFWGTAPSGTQKLARIYYKTKQTERTFARLKRLQNPQIPHPSIKE